MYQDKIIIIDVQGFYSANKFIPKEVCISSYDSQIKNFIIQLPFKYLKLMAKNRTTNNWLYNHFHDLRWDDGDSTLNVKEYLKPSIKNTQNLTVYVKGLEKLKWVKTLIGEEICIPNLDDFNCSNIDTLYKTDTNTNLCNYHCCKYRCALKNVILLRNYVKFNLKNKENIENVVSSRVFENLLKAYDCCIDKDHRTFFLKMIDELRIYNNLSCSPLISSSIYGIHRHDS
uniref:Uncharacterized protein n=1 Tax=Glossina palpalis gambiensis TaxID=67801 RepID=A0A1B0C2J6_9MUSC